MKNREIELKFVITQNQRNLILNELETEARFEGEKRQVDTYYIPNFKSFEENGETKECLRIRESGGKAGRLPPVHLQVGERRLPARDRQAGGPEPAVPRVRGLAAGCGGRIHHPPGNTPHRRRADRNPAEDGGIHSVPLSARATQTPKISLGQVVCPYPLRHMRPYAVLSDGR